MRLLSGRLSRGGLIFRRGVDRLFGSARCEPGTATPAALRGGFWESIANFERTPGRLLVFGQKETFVKGLKHPPYNVKPDFLPAVSSLFSTFLFLQKCLKRFSGQLMLGEQLSYLRLVVE